MDAHIKGLAVRVEKHRKRVVQNLMMTMDGFSFSMLDMQAADLADELEDIVEQDPRKEIDGAEEFMEAFGRMKQAECETNEKKKVMLKSESYISHLRFQRVCKWKEWENQDVVKPRGWAIVEPKRTRGSLLRYEVKADEVDEMDAEETGSERTMELEETDETTAENSDSDRMMELDEVIDAEKTDSDQMVGLEEETAAEADQAAGPSEKESEPTPNERCPIAKLFSQ
jgi:hypothetical protein